MSPLDRWHLVMPVPVRGAAKAVLIALAYHGLESWASQETLDREAGFSAKTIRAALKSLEAAGLISTRHGKHSNRYTLNVEALRAMATADRPFKPLTRKVVPTPHSEGSSAQTEGSSECGNNSHSEGSSAQTEGSSAFTRKVVPTNQEENQERNQGNARGAFQPWSKTTLPNGVSRARLESMVLDIAEGITSKRPKPERAASASKSILGLWRHEGSPDPSEFKPEVLLVARAARECPAGIFARDIRAEGWDNGTPRQRHIRTICVQSAFADRLLAAQEWAGETSEPTNKPWLAPPPPGQRVVFADSLAVREYVEANSAEIDSVRVAIREHGGEWPELHQWLNARVSDPTAVLQAIKGAA